MLSLTDPATNWSFDCLTDGSGKFAPFGGLALQNVRHDGHNFAKDIRVVAIWVNIETVDASGKVLSTSAVYSVLGPLTFTAKPLQILTPTPVTNPVGKPVFQYLSEADNALDFKVYFQNGTNYVGYGVRSDYVAANFFAAYGNCECTGLEIAQMFLFSRYGNSPAHEPSGALHAARCHPMMHFFCTANRAVDKTKTYTRVGSIRFDYRLHLYVDSQLASTTASANANGNNAGLFADSDAGSLLGALGSGIASTVVRRSTSMALSRNAFDAVEKPLVLEVTAPGLAKGFPRFSRSPNGSNPARCWDNMHWWGARGLGNSMISSPGAFHAAHLHWRWGAAAGIAIVAGQSGNPVFDGTGAPANAYKHPALGGAWGPLVDPNIWIQSVRVAVVKNDKALDPNQGASITKLSNSDWKTLFDPGLHAVPQDILGGDDIVLWYSIEVHREVTVPSYSTFTPPNYTITPAASYTAKSHGTVFIHGIFFAHDAEKTGFAVGSTQALHWPDDISAIQSAKKWFRSAA